MSRNETPADVQLARALIAVVLGLVFALGMLRPVVDVPSVRAAPAAACARSGHPRPGAAR